MNPDKDAQQSTEKLIAAIIQGVGPGQAVLPTVWTKRLQAKGLDINELAHTDYEGGRAYGAIAFQKLDFPFEQAKKELFRPGAILKLVRNVKTLRGTTKIESSKNSATEFCINTAIKVPVVSDFHTDVKVKLYDPSDRRTILEWRQVDDMGELSYNQGAAILEPDEGKSKVTVIGIHIIKPKNKVIWLARGVARSFAKTHYGNFVAALRKTVKDLQSQ